MDITKKIPKVPRRVIVVPQLLPKQIVGKFSQFIRHRPEFCVRDNRVFIITENSVIKYKNKLIQDYSPISYRHCPFFPISLIVNDYNKAVK